MTRLLCIEDDENFTTLIRRFVGNLLECDIIESRTMNDALTYLADDYADAVLLDLGLPDSDISNTVTMIPKLVAYGKPVIVLTGSQGEAADALRQRCIRNGARSFVQKDHIGSNAGGWNMLAGVIRDAWLVTRKTQRISIPQ